MPASPTLWLTGLAHAKAYRKAHGHLAVPQDWRTKDNYSLGKWITNRRQEAAAGKLDPDRHAALSRLGMMWAPHQAQWEKGLRAAAAYAARFGHLDVPQTFSTSTAFSLGRWLTSRRLECRKGRLAPEKVAALEALGILWEPRAQAWDEAFRQAQAYWRQHRHLLIPHDWRTEDGLELGSWIQVQRKEFRDGTLSAERQAALVKIGMAWNALHSQWALGLAQAQAYRRKHGHLRAPEGHVTPTAFALGKWLRSRRTEHRRGTLAPERVAALEALGIEWSTLESDWQEGLAQAKAWCRAHKRQPLNVPRRYVSPSGFTLGRWLSRQRQEFRAGKLAPERVAALEALRMVWDGRDKPAKAQPGAAQALGSRLAKTTPTRRSTSTTASKTMK